MTFCIACLNEATITLSAKMNGHHIGVCNGHQEMVERHVELAKSSPTMLSWFKRRYFKESRYFFKQRNVNPRSKLHSIQ